MLKRCKLKEHEVILKPIQVFTNYGAKYISYLNSNRTLFYKFISLTLSTSYEVYIIDETLTSAVSRDLKLAYDLVTIE